MHVVDDGNCVNVKMAWTWQPRHNIGNGNWYCCVEDEDGDDDASDDDCCQCRVVQNDDSYEPENFFCHRR